MTPSIDSPRVVTRAQWMQERVALLAQEKAALRESDRVAAARRALPWVRVDTPYLFDTGAGRCTLAELFEGRRQLVVQHFMLGPGWAEGCPSCSYMADHADGMVPHLAQRDIAFTAVSHAPWADIAPFRQRMGWRFRWVSSHGSDFNRDFAVSFAPDEVGREALYNHGTSPAFRDELPGLSVFVRDDAGAVFHSYSTYGRGVEAMMGTYRLVDLTPRGRDEAALPYTMAWVKHHDRYAPDPAAAPAAGCCAAHA